jgi:hypothetical protein
MLGGLRCAHSGKDTLPATTTDRLGELPDDDPGAFGLRLAFTSDCADVRVFRTTVSDLTRLHGSLPFPSEGRETALHQGFDSLEHG